MLVCMKSKARQYELLTREIYQQILNQEMAQTVSVDHDVSVEGLTTKHQIDVYWEFKLAGVRHRVLVQAKKWSRRVSKGAVLTFKGVLDDIPGTVGIIVTAKGYQRGALEVAKGYGIEICLLREIGKKNPPLCAVPGSTLTLSIKGFLMGADGKPGGFAWQADWLEPEFSGWTIKWDGDWLKRQQIPEALTPKIDLDFGTTELHDEDGTSRGTLRQVYISMRKEVCAEFSKSREAQGHHTYTFEGPTYVTASSLPKRVKILNISADYLVKERRENWEAPVNDVAMFILENVKDGVSHRFFVR